MKIIAPSKRTPRLAILLFFFLSVSGSSFGQWLTKSAALIKRSDLPASVAYNGKVYIFFGFYNYDLMIDPTAEVYDPALDTWTYLAPIPPNKAVTHQGVILVDDNIWHIGGRVGNHPAPLTSETWIYNIRSDSWLRGPDIIDPATGLPLLWGGGGAALLGRTVHIFGGFINNACNQDQDKYHLTLNIDDWIANPSAKPNWRNQSAPLPVKRNHFSTVVLGGKIYVLGGQFGHDCGGGQEKTYSHVYNPAINIWTELTPLPIPRSHCEGSTFGMDGKIYLLGGQGTNGASINTVTIFDPAGNNGRGTWRDDASLALPKKLEGASSKVIGNTIILSHGGEGTSRNPKNATFSRNVLRDPVYKLGFPAECAKLNAFPNAIFKTQTLLFTIDGSKNYTTSSNVSWLTISKNVIGTAIPNGVDIEVIVNTTGLLPGKYNGIITAKGVEGTPYYTSATYCVELTVLGPSGILEAERAILKSAVIASNHTGFTGTGFVDYINRSGDFIEWNFNKTAAGSSLLSFKYANGGSTNRPLRLEVNGVVISSSLSFPSTGAWNKWSNSKINVNLATGLNKVRLTAIGSSGANIDHLVCSNIAGSQKSLTVVPHETSIKQNEFDLQVDVYPNPAVGSTSLFVKTTSSLPVAVKLIDVTGRIHKNFVIKNPIVNSNFSFDNLPSGVYIIFAEQGSNNAHTKLLVRRR